MRKFFSAFVSASLFASVVSPVALAAELEITNNGANSDNTIVVDTSNTTVVDQSNESEILTGAFSKATTGGNTANKNTGGGDVTVTSGSATATTAVTVTGSSNEATVDPCPCSSTLPNITIEKNGAGSTNKVTYKKPNTFVAVQYNGSFVGTLAVSKAKTGKNKANKNTGGGNVTVTSGPAVDTTAVTVTGSSNTLNP